MIGIEAMFVNAPSAGQYTLFLMGEDHLIASSILSELKEGMYPLSCLKLFKEQMPASTSN